MSSFMAGVKDSVRNPSKWFNWDTQTRAVSTMFGAASSQDEIAAENKASQAAQEAVAQEAADKQAAADALTAAATAEAEKLRKRKGFKATNLTGTNQEALGGVATGKATMLG